MARKKTLDENILTDSTYYILLVLTKPMHGYGIMQEIKELSDNQIVIGPASLYTILKKLLANNLITLINNEERKKIYKITNDGKELLINDLKRRKLMVQHGENALSRTTDTK